MLIVGRAVAGMGSAGVGNGALTILSASVPLEKRACKSPTEIQNSITLLTVINCSVFQYHGLGYVFPWTLSWSQL